MREKVIDTALIAGLVIVAVVIVFTLFSPLPSRSRSAASPGGTEASAPAPSGEASEEASPADLTPVVPGAEPEASAQAQPAEPRRDAPDEAAPDDAAAAAPSADAIPLERVGFSYAGVVGACNVELEPWVHVAVSRDILERYPCGSEVTVVLDEPVAGRRSVRATVADTMGPATRRTANLYVDPSEPANEYGVTTGRLEP